jgi:hypothetical protein
MVLFAMFNGSLAFLLPSYNGFILIPYFLYCAVSGALLGTYLASK